jgi:hypothetical protein
MRKTIIAKFFIFIFSLGILVCGSVKAEIRAGVLDGVPEAAQGEKQSTVKSVVNTTSRTRKTMSPVQCSGKKETLTSSPYSASRSYWSRIGESSFHEIIMKVLNACEADGYFDCSINIRCRAHDEFNGAVIVQSCTTYGIKICE